MVTLSTAWTSTMIVEVLVRSEPGDRKRKDRKMRDRKIVGGRRLRLREQLDRVVAQ
jgi:hypothetical protein